MIVPVGVVAAVLWAVTRSEGPKVALVHDGSDTSVQQLTLDGWEQAQRDFDTEAATVVPLIDPEEDLRNLAEVGYNLIITFLFDRGTAAEVIAMEYPATRFLVLDGKTPRGKTSPRSTSSERKAPSWLGPPLHCNPKRVASASSGRSNRTPARPVGLPSAMESDSSNQTSWSIRSTWARNTTPG